MFDNMFESMKISATALSAERKRMNVIANNLANINTTRGPDGEPYRRKYVVFQTILDKSSDSVNNNFREKGVKLSEIVDDGRPFKMIYKPGHPDADQNGYVAMPNVDMVEENVDFLASSRAYGANLSVLKSSKALVKKMLELLTME
ncbi:MAG: hypothetical protein ACD_79C01261G0003 [uncultured bacterium]|nr:MAG: hypothetical protein ACD_79C01261G0003 [uncultured bacterium]